MNAAEAVRHLIENDPRFAVGNAEIRGIDYPVFRNAPNSLRAMMQVSRATHGDGDFLIQGDERWSYEGFCADVNRMASALAAHVGVGPGVRVAIAMRNCPEFLILMMAVTSLGGVVVLVNGWWTGAELEYGFTDSGAKVAFADGPRVERISAFAPRMEIRLIGVRDGEAEAPERFSDLLAGGQTTAWPTAPIHPDDDFAIMYSSGSTGHPKGVVLTHRGAISAVYTWVLRAEVAKLLQDPSLGVPVSDAEAPCLMIVTPLFHVTATHPLWLQSIVLGTRVVLMGKWDPAEAARIINREKVHRIMGVPTQTADLLEYAVVTGTAMPTLNYLGSGGAKRPPAQVGQLASAFPGAVIASGWGMTETNAVGLSISGPDYLRNPNATGTLQPPLQRMKIVNDDGVEVPTDAVGELVVKSAGNMRCYLNKPEETAEVLRDGWLYTGDLAKADANGIVTIVDRKKNIIIRGGENIACLEVEAALHGHDDVLEACVFSVPDDRLGESVGAGVQARAGSALNAEELAEFLSGQIAAFKIPTHVWFLDHPLPRGGTDKIDRRALRAACLGDLGTAPRRTG